MLIPWRVPPEVNGVSGMLFWGSKLSLFQGVTGSPGVDNLLKNKE